MTRCKPLMGTYVEITVNREDAIDDDTRMAAITNAFLQIETVQSRMSVFSASSDITRINTAAFMTPVQVHPWTWELLQLCHELYTDSDGAFDVNTGKWLSLRGHRPTEINRTAQAIGSMSHVRLLDDYRVAADRPVALDLGGIAKGFAVDRATESLIAHGCISGIVNAGGDLRVFGEIGHPIHVRSAHPPHAPAFLGTLAKGAIATSGNYFSQQHTGNNDGHLVNPKTGRSIRLSHSICVLSSSAVLADALTKVIALSGDLHHPLLAQHRATAFTVQ